MANKQTTDSEKWAYDIPLDTFKKGGEIYNYDVINQSIEMVLSSLLGRRLFNRGFGSDFPNRVFDNMTVTYGERLIDDTVKAIKRWEDRIFIIEDEVKLVLAPDQNMASLEIPYIIPKIGKKAIFKKKIVG